MKRFLIAATLVVTVLAVSFAADDNSLKTIKEKGKLIMGLDDSFPPMGYRNEKNEIVGYDVDLAKEVTKRLGITLELQPIDWNAKEQELNTGKIDCIWNGFTITEARAKVIAFTKPYMKNAQVMVVKENSPAMKLNDLVGKTVGLQAGSSAADALESDAKLRSSIKAVVEFKDNLMALMDLEIGGVDGVVMDLLVANDNIQRSEKAFRIISDYLAAEDFGVGFRKKDLALRDAVQSTLQAMAADGTLANITTAWFGADISTVGK